MALIESKMYFVLLRIKLRLYKRIYLKVSNERIPKFYISIKPSAENKKFYKKFYLS